MKKKKHSRIRMFINEGVQMKGKRCKTILSSFVTTRVLQMNFADVNLHSLTVSSLLHSLVTRLCLCCQCLFSIIVVLLDEVTISACSTVFTIIFFLLSQEHMNLQLAIPLRKIFPQFQLI